MKIIYNGKKIVKWFLRLLPIFVFIYVFIFSCSLAKNENLNTLQNTDLNQLATVGLENLNIILNEYGLPFFDIFGINENIEQWLTDNGIFWSNTIFSIDFVLSTLAYELLLSFLFLIFDVFNYMITICSKFLNKGENINE